MLKDCIFIWYVCDQLEPKLKIVSVFFCFLATRHKKAFSKFPFSWVSVIFQSCLFYISNQVGMQHNSFNKDTQFSWNTEQNRNNPIFATIQDYRKKF